MSSTTDASTGACGGEESTTTNRGLSAQRKVVEASLLSLKCLLFFFFGGLGCLLPFLPLHMLAVGLEPREIRTISMIAPTVAVLGPLIAGPLADRVAAATRRASSSPPSAVIVGNVESSLRRRARGGGDDQSGRYLRVMIACCCVFSALFYSLLLTVPSVQRIVLPAEQRPGVKFSCDARGAVVHQERCRNDQHLGCHRWSHDDVDEDDASLRALGRLRLKQCEYACYPPDERRRRGKFPPAQADHAGLDGHDEYEHPSVSADVLQDEGFRQRPVKDDDEFNVIPLETTPNPRYTAAEKRASRKSKRHVVKDAPQVCYKDKRNDRSVCHVFTDSKKSLLVDAALRQATNPEDTEDWCVYPVAQHFDCTVPQAYEIAARSANQSCVVECSIDNPYDTEYGETSVLSESQCGQVIGNEQLTFWMYLAIRSLADIFPMAGLTLVQAAVVLATRETACGRGDVGRQLAFGSAGFAVFGTLAGYLASLTGTGSSMAYYAPLTLHGLLATIAACVALSADSMPLAPPDWWWHTRSGCGGAGGVLPMSNVRRYGGEAAALFLVLLLAGTLWSTIDMYLPIHLLHLKSNELTIGIAMTVGAVPAILFLCKSERLVDYCGHSNLLIIAFVFYIVRFTGLSLVTDIWWTLLVESLELFTLSILWITAMLYFRHLIPRQMTTSGQALPVIAHFCIGRAIGSIISACVDKVNRDDEVVAMRYIYQCLAIASAVIATLYFATYHAVLKPRCHHAQSAQQQNGQRNHTPSIVQAMNGNGSYTPLKVYHNGSNGRKGNFRY
ncbi:hypothetical protein TKK_0012667 [Trichogramma kaykai]|uniref:Major facilitator superfamily associated domain-containing protein n=1 Tax=Trichogramma kaykai TaxID=54128 RepID=A0ABD2WME6_9HYME